MGSFGLIMKEEKPDDYVLVEAAKTNSEAFGNLYEKYLNRVFHYQVVRSRGDVPVAEDLTSDTFMRALRYFPKFEMTHPQSFEIWLLRIASSVRSNYLRWLHHHSMTNLEDPEVRNRPSSFPGPEEFAEKSYNMRRLSAAINSLPLAQRQAIHLRYVEGLSLDEIGEVTGKKGNAAKAQVRRATEQLKKKMTGADLTTLPHFFTKLDDK